jgi:adenosylhomocysteine nucleosidase
MVSKQAHKSMGRGLALVVALPEEARGILKAGKWQRVSSSASLATYLGHVGGVAAVLAVSGMGKAKAEATTREVIAQHHPNAVISLGFAGGLAGGLAAGDIVVAETLMSADTAQGQTLHVTESLASNTELVLAAQNVLTNQAINHQSGSCLTTSQVASHSEDKAALRKATGALVVDMESYWIGRVCDEHAVPFLAVRAIIDTLEHQLPDYVTKFAFAAANKSRWRQALPALLRPWWIPGLVRLGAASSRAQKGLASFAVSFLESYAQEPVAPK